VKLYEDPILIDVVKEVGKIPSQVALKFLLQLSPVVNIVPKSITLSRIRENFDLNFELNSEQMAKLKKRNCNFPVHDYFIHYGIDALSFGH
jgi:diketogulonate reductase-like aldo/keto reductase